MRRLASIIAAVGLFSFTNPIASSMASGNLPNFEAVSIIQSEPKYKVQQFEQIALNNGNRLLVTLDNDFTIGSANLNAVVLNPQGSVVHSQSLLPPASIGAEFSWDVSSKGQVALLVNTEFGMAILNTTDGVGWSNPIMPVHCSRCDFGDSSIAFGRGDSVAILWRHYSDRSESVLAASSIDGVHWSPPSLLDDSGPYDFTWADGALHLEKTARGFAAAFSSKTNGVYGLSTSYLSNVDAPQWTRSSPLAQNVNLRFNSQPDRFHCVETDKGVFLHLLHFSEKSIKWIFNSSKVECHDNPAYVDGFATKQGDVDTYSWLTQDGQVHTEIFERGLFIKTLVLKRRDGTDFDPEHIRFVSQSKDESLAIVYEEPLLPGPHIAVFQNGKSEFDGAIPKSEFDVYEIFATQSPDANISLALQTIDVNDSSWQLELSVFKQASKPVLVKGAKLNGIPARGKKLTAVPAVFSTRSGIDAISFQWYECSIVVSKASMRLPTKCQSIKGQVKTSFHIPKQERGKSYLFATTAKNSLGAVTSFSATTKIIK